MLEPSLWANPLIAMGFRLRRSARLGPLRFNFSSGGLSSISVGGRGASFNIPVNRRGGPRTTVGLPGTGLSWSMKHTPDRPAAIRAGAAEGLPNSRRLRPGQLDALKQSLLAVLCRELFAAGPSRRLPLWPLGGVGSLETAKAGARRAGSPYSLRPPGPPQQAKDGAGNKENHRMREVVFRLEAERPGHLEARAETLPIHITAPTLEELQHEAREALIAHMGPAHGTVRVGVRRGPTAAVSSIRPVGRPAALCC